MKGQYYRYILIAGCLLAFLTFFLGPVSTYFFPYITPKQIFFNILIEIMAVFWIAYILKFPEARPKKSFITIGLAAFFGVLLVSCFTGIDFNLSFWGDLERMLGWFHIFHFLLLYLMIITVFRTETRWKILMNVAIASAVYVSIYGFYIGDSISTIGQNAYVAGMMIFTIYFAVIQFTRSGSSLMSRCWYIFATVLMLLGMINSNVSGAYLGLGVSIFVFFVVLAIVIERKKIRIAVLSSLAVILLGAGTVFVLRDNAVFDNTIVAKIFRDFSTSNKNLNTRRLAWEGALKDFSNHPILGTGYGNFAIAFDQNFSPEFIKYANVEENFDRAHNNIIDILTTSGVLGLVAYLFFCGATVYYVVAGYRKGKLDKYEVASLLAVLAGYFVHNLAVFDALVSYILLMSLLGYVYYVSEIRGGKEVYLRTKPVSSTLITLIITSVSVFSIFVIFNYGSQTVQMIERTIKGLQMWSAKDVQGALNSYKIAHLLNNPLDRDSKNNFVELISNEGKDKMSDSDNSLKEEVYKYSIKIASENVSLNKYDYFGQMMLAKAYESLAVFYKTNSATLDKDGRLYLENLQRALETINYSMALGSSRMAPRLVKANIYLSGGDLGNAIKTYQEAIKTNPNYPEVPCYLGNLQFNSIEWLKTNGNPSEDLTSDRFLNLTRCIDNGRSDLITSEKIRNEMVDYLTKNNDTERLLRMKN